jgi:uncharacterized integral membrane protein
MSGHQEPSGPGAGTEAAAGPGRRRALTPNRVLALVLTALAVVLIVENSHTVRIRLLVPVVTLPLYSALLIMFVLGALAGALYVYGRRRRKRRRYGG